MKHALVLAAFVSALHAPGAWAQSTTQGSTSEERLSFTVVLSAAASVLIIASPFLIVKKVGEDSSDRSRHVQFQAQDKVADAVLPDAVVQQAQLKEGDKLTVKPHASGALLLKNDQPVAYVIPQQNASLSKNVELAR